MTTLQKVITYLAIAFAIFLIVSIVGGILSAVGAFSIFSVGDAVTEDMKTYSFKSDIRELRIEINAADLGIKEGESFSVESNLKYLEVKEDGGCLTVKETKKISGNAYRNAVLTVYVPASTEFERVVLTTGAGRLAADTLTAGTLRFELGAGDVSIGCLTATNSADIDGGAGRITISGGKLNDLDLDMGVGQMNLISALSGDCKLDLGIGESNITILGVREDYRLSIEKGIGSVTLDGKRVSNLSESGSGQNRVQFKGGIGGINVRFQEDDAA